ncbi:hypothetical protein Ahia01_000867700, partial [Argonauta hians]
YMMHLIDLSDIMLALVREYQHNSIFPKSYKMVLLTIMQKYSSNSVSCASQMVEGDLGCALMSQVTPTASLEFMMVVITILWNMHDKVEHTNTFVSQLRTGGSVRKLKLLFEHLVRESKTQHARQMRNNILVIVAQIATANPFTPFLEIGFLKQLIAYSIYPEVSIEEPCYFELKLKRCAEDFEMKKLLFSIMASLCHVNTTLEMMRSGKLLLGMFCYLETREKCRIDWLPAEYEEMQMHVLSCMCILCPLLPHCFILYNGPQLLLNFLNWCNSTIKFKGHGNCFLGEGSRGTKVAQTRLGLRLLFNMVATKDDKILAEFVDKGIISLILSMLDVALIDVSTCVKISNEMKTNLLMSISMFCEGNLQRKVLFGRRGVNIVMCFLRCDLDLLKSGLDYHFLLLTAIDCIWCTVIGCKELEDHFLEEDGCYILLDLLEVLPHKMRGIFLGCLVDLCFVNPKTIKHILTWRGSKTSISAPKLFCDIWRQEEKDMEVLSDSNGVISNIIFPLAGSIQRKQGIVLQPAKCASPAIVEVSENMRAKIYCLFTKIGFKNLPGMKLLDHIKLLVIECYMDFKTGEVWMEIIHELCSEHKATIEHDWNVCYAILRHYYHLSEQIKKAQDHIMCSYNKCNSLNEQQYYAQIRENYVQKEKEDDIWVKFVARTSRYSMLQAAKQRQRLSIESSRRDSSYMLSQLFHSIEWPNLGTTVLGSILVRIESTPRIRLNNSKF